MRNSNLIHHLRPLPWVITVVTALAGCASQTVSGPAVQPLVAANVGANLERPAANAANLAIHDDPALAQLIRQALSGHPTLQLADARLRAALAGSEQVSATDGLRANGNVSHSRNRISEFDRSQLPAARGQWGDNNSIAVDLSYRLDFWGRTREAVRASRLQAEAARLEADDARQWLVWAITHQYLGWRAAQAANEVLMADEQVARQLQQQAQSRLQSGMGTPDELQQATLQLAEARERQQRGQLREATARHALAALSNQTEAALAALPAGTLPDWPLDWSTAGMQALGNRSDIRTTRLRTEAASAGIAAARAEFYPDLKLSALLSLTASDLGDVLSYGARAVRAGPVLTLPVFNQRELNARLDSRTAEYDAAAAQYNQTLLEAIRDSSDRASSVAALQASEQQARTAAEARTQLAASAASRLKHGLGNRSNWLQAQRQAHQGTLTLIDTRLQRLQAQAALLRSLGLTDTTY